MNAALVAPRGTQWMSYHRRTKQVCQQSKVVGAVTIMLDDAHHQIVRQRPIYHTP
jgi:hypothetical protein